ncbi:zinc finger MYND domain-containing protein [Phanerochaete sordida]|uniref:Zinc finger MYND domain-containing protein n=1 Tax=Phanerochaete sordida TaxID=48140 RepID=A0A9P3GAB6_9APHY|nr:zinc finger MYND domain-containing protein [Phanerochaete sordida]
MAAPVAQPHSQEPSSVDLPTEFASKATFSLPEHWGELFESVHRQRECSDVATRRDLLIQLKAAHHDELWERGVLLMILDAFADADLCGYGRAELLSDCGDGEGALTERQDYVLWMLLSLDICLSHITPTWHNYSLYLDKRTEAANFMRTSRYTNTWAALLEWLTHLAHGSAPDIIHEGYLEPASLYKSAVDCVPAADTIIRTVPNMSRAPASPHVLPLLLLVWAFSDDYPLHVRAMNCVGEAVEGEFYFGKLKPVGMCRSTSQPYLRRLYQDLADARLPKEALRHLHAIVGVIWPYSSFRIETTLERRIFGRLLSCYRHQLCVPYRTNGPRLFSSEGEFHYVKYAIYNATVLPLARLPEHQVYEIIGIIAAWLIPAITEDYCLISFQSSTSLPTTLSSCCRLLGTYRTPRAALAPLRRHVYRAWCASIEELERKHDFRELPRWRKTIVEWRKLGRCMPADAREKDVVDEATHGVLKRCAWKECECSVHKPLHPMKVCTGCWITAYCGVRCQQRDWEKGAHRHACREFVGE